MIPNIFLSSAWSPFAERTGFRAVGKNGHRSLAARRLCESSVDLAPAGGESGDADAAFNLGQAYRLGRGVTINLGAAKTWF